MFDNGLSAGNATLNSANSAEYAYKAAIAAQNAPQVATPARGSDAAIQRIVHQFDMLTANAHRVDLVADRLSGSRPRDVSATGQAGSGSVLHLSAKLNMIGDALAKLNSDLSESADRLESFI